MPKSIKLAKICKIHPALKYISAGNNPIFVFYKLKNYAETMTMNKTIVVASLLLMLSACRYLGNAPDFLPREGGDGYIRIDMDMDNIPTVAMDTIIKEVKFVPLETRPDCLIGSYDKVIVLQDTIYILDRTQQKAVFAFDTQGRFLYKISALGRGPGEYSRAYDFYVDTVSSHIGILDYGKVQKYDFEGKHIGQVKLQGGGASNITYNEGKYNGRSFDGWSKDRSYVFAQFDSLGNLVYRDHPTSNELIEYGVGRKGYFASNGKGTYFNDFASDTIYRITDAYLEPAFVLDYGKSALSLDVRDRIIKETLFDQITYFRDKEHLIFFGLHYMSMSDHYLLMGVPYGASLKYALYSFNSHEIKLLEFTSTHLSVLRPQDIRLSGSYFYGLTYPNYIYALHNADYNDLNLTDKEINHPLFYQNVSNRDSIRGDDNAIVCLFSLVEL